MDKKFNNRLLSLIISAGLGGLLLSAYLIVGMGARAGGGTVWYVSTNGNDANDCLSLALACKTIQSAHDRAASGDTIQIATGVYTQHTTLTRSLYVDGEGMDLTVIDGGNNGRVFTITEFSTTSISNLTIQNGRAITGSGVYNSGFLIIQNCRIKDNSAVGLDGISATESGGSAAAGGIFNDSTLSVINCILENNQAVGGDGAEDGYGGGAFGGTIYNTGILTMSSSTVSGSIAAGGNGGNLKFSQGTFGGFARGGAIYSQGTLALANVDMEDNLVQGGDSMSNNDFPFFVTGGSGDGGAVYSIGLFTADEISMTVNIAQGGIVSGSSINLNGYGQGGGLYGSGTIVLNSSQILSNTADAGGGITSNPYFAGYDSVTITNSIFQNNVAYEGNGGAMGDGCSNNLDCFIFLNQVTMSGNSSGLRGGGFSSSNGSGSTSEVTILNSTFDNNLADDGGGGLTIENQIGGTKSAVVVNSTISGNDGGNRAGGILLYTTSQSTVQISLINSSLISNTANNGSAIYAFAGGSGPDSSKAYFKNSLIANDLSTNNCATGNRGAIISNGHNLENGHSCNFIATGDITDTIPLVGPLADNGGPTLTHELLIGSPALDTADNPTCQSSPVNGLDQRGVFRPFDGDGSGIAVCDIGAYELDTGLGTPTATPTETATPSPTNTPSATPTASQTPTPKATPTHTPTATATATASATASATATSTATATATPTATAMPTSTPTSTAAATATATRHPEPPNQLFLPYIAGKP